MKIIYLSTILAISLFTSASSVWAMDNAEAESFATHALPKFPLTEAGERIAAQNYSITGREIKSLIARSAVEEITDKRTLLGSGVWVSNLSDYQKIRDDQVYNMVVKTVQVDSEELHSWETKGDIPDTKKEFLLMINSYYDPFHFGYPKVY